MELLSVFTVCVGLIMSWIVFLHVRTMIKEKTSAGQDIPAIAVCVFGFVVYMIYGFSIKNWVLIVTNINSTICYIIYLLVALKYKGIKHADNRNVAK